MAFFGGILMDILACTNKMHAPYVTLNHIVCVISREEMLVVLHSSFCDVTNNKNGPNYNYFNNDLGYLVIVFS